jgi:hypothetical protein
MREAGMSFLQAIAKTPLISFRHLTHVTCLLSPGKEWKLLLHIVWSTLSRALTSQRSPKSI